jgi:competence protein ComEC
MFHHFKILNMIGAVCLSLLLLLAGCGSTASSSQSSAASSGGAAAVSQIADNDKALHVTMLNVGQADATLIQYKGKNMLIDTGDVDSRDDLVQQLKKRNVKTLDIIVITHPHGDHLGGMAALFKNFTIKQIYDNGQPANTAMYKNYLKNIKAKNISYSTLKKGDSITLADDIHFQVLSPGTIFTTENTDGVSQSGLTNDNSIVCKMTYGKFSVMFMGDAQKEAENQILKDYDKNTLKADILKTGHHGSKTSSSPAFIKAVAPKAATISCGQGNQYKLPHEQTLQTLQKQNITIYRTDRNGAVSILSDGSGYTIQTEHGN